MEPTLYALRVPSSVAALIRGLHPQLKRKVRAALRAILDDPRAGKPLRDEFAGLRAYRVSRIRVVYRLSGRGEVVELVVIGPRARIYEETLRQVERDERRNR